MTHPSKRKGNQFERELVRQAREAGLPADRCWASDGRSAGLPPEVDVVVNGWPIQAKRRAQVAAYLNIPDGCRAVAFRQDRGPALVLMELADFLEIVRNGNHGLDQDES